MVWLTPSQRANLPRGGTDISGSRPSGGVATRVSGRRVAGEKRGRRSRPPRARRSRGRPGGAIRLTIDGVLAPPPPPPPPPASPAHLSLEDDDSTRPQRAVSTSPRRATTEKRMACRSDGHLQPQSRIRGPPQDAQIPAYGPPGSLRRCAVVRRRCPPAGVVADYARSNKWRPSQ